MCENIPISDAVAAKTRCPAFADHSVELIFRRAARWHSAIRVVFCMSERVGCSDIVLCRSFMNYGLSAP